jgi:hypothetical protein
MEQLISLAHQLEFSPLSIEQFRSRAVEIISALSGDELLNVALMFADAEMDDDEYDAGAIIRP